MIVGVSLALGSAALYGASDYFGATAARRMRVLPATTLTYAFAAFAFAVLLPFSGGIWSPAAVLWGAAAGVCAVVGFLSFYAAMAAGPMSLMSPLMAVLESAVPVLTALALGERLALWGWIAIGLALIAGILISTQPGDRGGRVNVRPLLLAVISGVSLGFSVVALDLAPHASGLVPGLLELLVGLVLLGALAALPRIVPRARSLVSLLDADALASRELSRRRVQVVSAAAGLLLGGANAFLILALHTSSLAVVSVLVGLYPLGTILLARALIKERLAAGQLFGVALAFAASVMFALA